jgi:hypothetical protein
MPTGFQFNFFLPWRKFDPKTVYVHFGYEFLDNPLVISKTTKEKDDSYKGHSILLISFNN